MEALAAIHETMEALHETGASDKQTMRHFDEACLTPVRPLTADEIKQIREREKVSQTDFANYLNVTAIRHDSAGSEERRWCRMGSIRSRA